MLNITSKPADQIGIRDIEELIEAEVPEGQQLEFKEALSTEKGKAPEHALLEGAVAFANAQGGTLLLGVKEPSKKPPIDTRITPVPDCVELADRISKKLRDYVEPKIPAIEVFGVPVEGDSGLVIIRVGRSRLAPHWVKKNRACKIRRADRSEQMTMWEVQDMTLNASRGMKDFEERLRERSKKFQQELEHLETPEEAFGIRLTALPVGGDVRFDSVYLMMDKHELSPFWEQVFEKEKNDGRRALNRPTSFFPLTSPGSKGFPSDWQPRLRSTRRSFAYPKDEPILPPEPSYNETYMFSYQELHCDGMLELGYASCNQGEMANKDSDQVLSFDPDWPLYLLANTLRWVTHIRSQSPAPLAEYGLQIEIRHSGEKAVKVGKSGTRYHFSPPLWDIRRGYISNIEFPPYYLNDEETPAALLQTFCRDFLNWLKTDKEIEFEIGEKHYG